MENNLIDTSGSITPKPLDLSKFPSWNGRKDTWDTFHTKLKAILSMNKLRRLLEKDNKNKDDSEQLYHILAHCTVNGLMKNTVLQYESSLNGIQAWKDLYTVMEQTELDNVIEFQGLANLVTLEKKHGFESFLNDYHAAMKKADPDGTMKESKKKFYLLHAIKKDTRYAYTADACDNESLLKTITKLRIKAQELKDLDTQATGTTTIPLLLPEATKRNGIGTTSPKVEEIKLNTTLDPVETQTAPTLLHLIDCHLPYLTRQVQRRRGLSSNFKIKPEAITITPTINILKGKAIRKLEALEQEITLRMIKPQQGRSM